MCIPRHFSLREREREREREKHGIKDGRERWEVVWGV
jgi:hypothetical protein